MERVTRSRGDIATPPMDVAPRRSGHDISPRALRLLSVVQKVGCAVAAAIGLAVLTGYATGRPALLTAFVSGEPVAATTAACFILLSISTFLKGRAEAAPTPKWVALWCAVGTAATALFDLIHFAVHPDHWLKTGPDQILVGMAPVTAITLILLAVAIALPDGLRLWRQPVATALATAAGVVLVVVIFGYIFDVEAFSDPDTVLVPVLATTLALFALLIAGFTLNPRRGWTGLVMSRTPEGTLLRVIVPATLIIPLIIEMSRLYAVDEHRISRELSSALAVGVQMVILTSVALGAAFLLRKRDEAKREVEDRLHEAEARFRNDLERLVEVRTNELAAANQELEAFSYSVSHDLRAPLRSMDGFSRLLLEEAHDIAQQSRSYLERIRKASQMMAQLIDDLLSLSRVTQQEMRKSQVDLTALAQSVIAELRTSEPERRVDVTIADRLEATGDPALLRIVLQNLLGNAWKFTSRKEYAAITFDALGEGDRRTFYVRDNGAGFDPRYGETLFTAFQRLHRTSEFEGTGIGLATVQRIIRRHGGRIRAEGLVGEGATIFFTLG